MSNALPPHLRSAIAGLTRGTGLAGVAAASDRMSAAYRSGHTSAAMQDRAAVAAYLHARFPATFAAISAALRLFEEQHPDCAPRSLLDLGCGPGTATFAAIECFPSLTTLTGIDSNPAFLEAARRISEEEPGDGSRRFDFRNGDLRQTETLPGADLVTLAYALVELPLSDAGPLAVRLFARADTALVLVEPGTPAGFERIRAARTALIGAGAHVAAPCTHAAPCPLVDPDWCHFSVRLARSREHQRVKAATLPFEDEKFSCLVATRVPPAVTAASRILRPPHETKAGIDFTLCNGAGASRRRISRRDPDYRIARRLTWGDLLPEM